MITRHFLHIILLLLAICSACNFEALESEQLPSFDKLYAVSENVEAVDFICKPESTGYIVVGNLKSEENSDIIVINVANNGLQRSLYQITTDFYDEAVSVKFNEADNSVYILGNRRTDQSQVNVHQNILIKTNLDGIPARASNANIEDSLSAEIKTLGVNQNRIVQLNDFLILPPNIICVGNIRQSSSGNLNRYTQIFDLTAMDFNDKNDSIITAIRQKPDDIVFNNSTDFKIRKGNTPNRLYEVLGQNFSENPNGSVSGSSDNISWHIYSDLNSTASEIIYIGSDQNEEFGDILYHSNGKNYIAGNYIDNDSIFLISKDYNGKNNNEIQSIYSFSEFGNKITSLTEDGDGNIIISTIDEGSANHISYLLKFSQSGNQLEGQNFMFNSTGFYDIQKIVNEGGNSLVILSHKTFDNNSTAIGLMKINF